MTTPSWASLADGLPTHWDEVLAAHSGLPTTATQNVTHGAPAPAPDHGIGDQAKYGSAPSAL